MKVATNKRVNSAVNSKIHTSTFQSFSKGRTLRSNGLWCPLIYHTQPRMRIRAKHLIARRIGEQARCQWRRENDLHIAIRSMRDTAEVTATRPGKGAGM